jgi:hypothetical protein
LAYGVIGGLQLRRNLDIGLAEGRLCRSGMVRISSYLLFSLVTALTPMIDGWRYDFSN